MYRLLFFIVFFSIFSYSLHSQLSKIQDGTEAFFFDVVIFKSDTANYARIDCYVMVPYQSLTFVKFEDNFIAKINVFLTVYDSLGNTVATKNYDRVLVEKDFNVAQGATAKFDVRQVQFLLPPGNYQIKSILTDENSKAEYSQSRSLHVVDFTKYDNVMSGLLLVSSIEEDKGRWKITPHISDNIGSLRDGFFVFFEYYSNLNHKVDFLYQIFENDELIEQGTKIQKEIEIGTNRLFIRVKKPAKISRNNYTLRLLALKPNYSDDYEIEDILAVAQRSIKSITRLSGFVLNDLDKAIRQLRYVANSEDINYIRSANTEDEKFRRFNDFWKSLDPTPNSERNEAFEQYYLRVAYANENFRSYTEGWLTDRGMVYIIFGQPLSVERSNPMSDGRVYERWIYSDNREFLFLDNTGFGDFRLVRPISVTEKYRYRN
ncbi:MAG TPA: GWxTD domain-containing protein [Candidatus Kapabacteria bacterium]|nr:GWxTD domain-containing protein [Candidatus Kapabacteria bacterium]